MVGRCYADEVWVTCMDAIIELSRAGTLGYDQEQSVGNLRMMKPLIAAYSICESFPLLPTPSNRKWRIRTDDQFMGYCSSRVMLS